MDIYIIYQYYHLKPYFMLLFVPIPFQIEHLLSPRRGHECNSKTKYQVLLDVAIEIR